MLKSISLFALICAVAVLCKEDSDGKKKEDVGTVIGIDLGVSLIEKKQDKLSCLFDFRQHIHA